VLAGATSGGMSGSRHYACSAAFGTYPTAPPTCCPHCYQRAFESASGTISCRYNRRQGSVLQRKLQHREQPSHTQFLALCGPYSSIYAGVAPRPCFPGVRRAVHRPPCPRRPLWHTQPPFQRHAVLAPRINFCRGMKQCNWHPTSGVEYGVWWPCKPPQWFSLT
jgi:hypothetical protein